MTLPVDEIQSCIYHGSECILRVWAFGVLDESSYSDDNADGDDCVENDDDIWVCTSGSVGLYEPVPALRASVSHRAPTRHFAHHPTPLLWTFAGVG